MESSSCQGFEGDPCHLSRRNFIAPSTAFAGKASSSRQTTPRGTGRLSIWLLAPAIHANIMLAPSPLQQPSLLLPLPFFNGDVQTTPGFWFKALVLWSLVFGLFFIGNNRNHHHNASLCGFCKGPLLAHRVPPVIEGRRDCSSFPSLPSSALPLMDTAAGANRPLRICDQGATVGIQYR